MHNKDKYFSFFSNTDTLQLFLFSLATIMCLFFAGYGFSQALSRRHNLFYLFLVPATLCIVCVGVYYVNITKSKYIDIAILILLAFIPRFLLATNTWAKPTSDFLLYYNSAMQLASGDIEGIRNPTYMFYYPYLQPFVVFESLLIRLFGTKLVTLRLFNCIITTGICILIYLIGSCYERRVGLVAGIIYALYISNIVMTSVLTCQHISTLLYYMAFYVFTVKAQNLKKKIFKNFFVGILLGFANLMRGIAPPILLAIVFFMLFGELRIKNLKGKTIQIASAILVLTVIMGGYTIVNKGFDCYAYIKGYRDEVFISADIRYKIALGLNTSQSGYSNSQIRAVYNAEDEELKKQMLKDFTTYLVQNPDVFVNDILVVKMGKMFGAVDSSYGWLYGDHLQQLKERITEDWQGVSYYEIARYEKCYMMQHYYNYIDFSYQIFVMMLAAVGFWKCRMLERKNFLTLFCWIILGYVGSHVFLEAQQRYRYFGMPIFFLFAALGMVRIGDFLKKFSRQSIE